MPRLKLLLNIGTADRDRLGLKKTRDGETVSVSEAVAKELLSRGWAAPEGQDAPVPSARPSTRQATDAPAAVNVNLLGGDVDIDEEADDEDEAADESPVSASNADEAVDQISRMRKRENLQKIIDTDTRVSVKKAAQDRLASL